MTIKKAIFLILISCAGQPLFAQTIKAVKSPKAVSTLGHKKANSKKLKIVKTFKDCVNGKWVITDKYSDGSLVVRSGNQGTCKFVRPSTDKIDKNKN